METLRRTGLGAARLLLPVVVGLVGAWLALYAFSGSGVAMGPFTVELSSSLGRGETSISLPPLGALTADTHDAPLRLTATLRAVDVTTLGTELRRSSTRALADRVERDALDALRPYAVRILALAAIGAAILSALAFRRNPRAIALATAASVVVVGGSCALAWQSWRPEAFLQPRFSGSLEIAPQLIGSVGQVTDRLEAFRRELDRVVSSAVRAYTALEPEGVRGGPDEIRVLHISDVHLSPLGFDLATRLVEGFKPAFILDTGDLTSYGTPLEESVLERIPGFGVPYAFVRGNHDSIDLQQAMEQIPNAVVLDGTAEEIAGLLVYGLGHPAFTEDKQQELDHPEVVDLARSAAGTIAADLETLARPPDILAVHDDRMARALAGRMPLVVSGHHHRADHSVVDGTLFLRGGTVGGAGVNLLSEPGGVALSAQILYFWPEDGALPRLIAYDRIEQSPTTGSLRIDRRLVGSASLDPSPNPAPG